MVTQSFAQMHIFDNSTGIDWGALNYWAGDTGEAMDVGAPVNAHHTYGSLGSVLGTDRCRLIGVAFEVHNTTAEVYKQGSLTVAQLPDSCVDAGTVHYITSMSTLANRDATVCQLDRALVEACTVTPLRAVPGSQTWPAAQGVYCVPRMTEVPRNIQLYKEGGPFSDGNVSQDGYGHSGRIPVVYGTNGKLATPSPSGTQSIVDGGVIPYDRYIFHPFAPNGFAPMQVWFSGLSMQTSLTISFRTIVEYFPALTSPLLPLASPSPIFDPKALALYSAVAARAPYAVPVDQNEAGEYFRKILRILSQGLGLISPIFGQYAPLASIASEAGVSWSRKLDRASAGPGAVQGKMSRDKRPDSGKPPRSSSKK